MLKKTHKQETEIMFLLLITIVLQSNLESQNVLVYIYIYSQK